MVVDILYLAWNRLEFTKFTFDMLLRNTDWDLVNRLHVHDDGSEDGTAEWLSDAIKEMPVTTSYSMDSLRSPPAVMNRYVADSEADVFGKIDNDIVVPPGWLNRMLGVMAAYPELELLGMEAGRTGASPTDESWDGLYRYEEGSHMGGVGLIRVESLARRPKMPEDRGRFGWTEWQHEYQPKRGWIYPDLLLCSLDQVPFEPWQTYAREYAEKEWARIWSPYHARANYWSWWHGEGE